MPEHTDKWLEAALRLMPEEMLTGIVPTLVNRIGQFKVNTASRSPDQICAQLERLQVGEQIRLILQSCGVNSLIQSNEIGISPTAIELMTPSGLKAFVSSDVGALKVQSAIPINEDCVGYNLEAECFAVADGVYNSHYPQKASRLACEAVLRSPCDMKTSLESRKKELDGGASCLTAFTHRMEEDGRRILSILQSGNVHIGILKPDATIRKESFDHTPAGQILKNPDGMVTKEIKRAICDEENRKALLHCLGDQADMNVQTEEYEWEVFPGDRIIMYTDGFSDCFTLQEIASHIQGLSLTDACKKAYHITNERMGTTFYLSEDLLPVEVGPYMISPSRDNRGIIIVDVPTDEELTEMLRKAEAGWES